MTKPALPSLSTHQMQDLDRFMTHKTGIPVLVMMEHAGLAVARLAQDMLLPEKRKILIIAGSGHNGGDGLVTARHLTNWGYSPTVVIVKGKQTKKATKKQIYMLRQMKLPLIQYNPKSHKKLEKLIGKTNLIIDALIGYNLHRKLRSPTKNIINSINQSGKPVLAIDGPSGLNFDTGTPQPVAIKATQTLTLGLPKVGLTQPKAQLYVGKLATAYISIPETVYHKLGLPLQIQFAAGQTIESS